MLMPDDIHVDHQGNSIDAVTLLQINHTMFSCRIMLHVDICSHDHLLMSNRVMCTASIVMW